VTEWVDKELKRIWKEMEMALWLQLMTRITLAWRNWWESWKPPSN